MSEQIYLTVGIALVIIAIGILILIIKMFRKALQGQALVRTGFGGTKVSFSGLFVVPVIHKLEIMDITLKTIVIARTGKEGLICKDNMRADIKVTFFVRVNQTVEDVKQVAQSIGSLRASHQESIELLFDAKFSEALKTVGKNFDFVELYNSRDDFKQDILNIIGTDLNGYVLDDCAIDYLEQTPLYDLDEKNILDAQGIKKIIELTATEKMKSNQIEREKEKTLKKQDVEAQETILELDKQKAEAEAKQKREIETIQSREEAEAAKVKEEERLKAEKARIIAEEEIQVAEQNRLREVVVAEKNKERTEAVEAEKVDRAKKLEETEKQRLVEIAEIEKIRAVEEERKNIQDVIRERVSIEKTVVEEKEKMKDIEAIAEAERAKKVAITLAEKDAEEALVKQIKDAEAKKQASEHYAKQALIDAQAEESAALHKAAATKTLAEAQAAEAAAIGMSEAQVMEAKAAASEKEGEAAASVIEMQAEAEAKGIREKGLAQAEADEKLGLVDAKINLEKGQSEAKVIEMKAAADEQAGMAEARVMNEKFSADAEGIKEKAEAMKALDEAGRGHEEFKIQIQNEKEIELSKIAIQKEIALSQAQVISEALRAANIDIVGGETMFFDQIVGSITKGKSVDKLMSHSETLTQVKDTFFSNDSGDGFKKRLSDFIGQFGMSAQDVKDLSVASLLLKLTNKADNQDDRNLLRQLGGISEALGISESKVEDLNI
ncbi:flotillin family protein [Reichenbachiella versicolor]|uniref:flotillin n=1 Tax=Reichenbachiella versicolor TaxID=1821036 RepID=UPI000D6E8247|nr:flotillin [Reichenbachiella versicolor]